MNVINTLSARFPRREVQVECGRVDRAVHGPRAENAPNYDLAQGASSLFAGRGPRAKDWLSHLGPRQVIDCLIFVDLTLACRCGCFTV